MSTPTTSPLIEEFENQFKEMLDLVESHTGQSERENIKDFLSKVEQEKNDEIKRIRLEGYMTEQSTIERCLKALPEIIDQKRMEKLDYGIMTSNGFNICLHQVISAMKKEFKIK